MKHTNLYKSHGRQGPFLATEKPVIRIGSDRK